jgi:hypothetical protein
MVTSSRYLVIRSSALCAFCNKPFHSRDGYIEFWRTSDGHHFCSEFCADDAEEAQFRKRRAAPHSVPLRELSVQAARVPGLAP